MRTMIMTSRILNPVFISICTGLSFCILLALFLSSSIVVSSKTSATTSSTEVDVTVNVQESLSATSSSDIDITLNAGDFSKSFSSITVATNNSNGYTLTAEVKGSDNKLHHETPSITSTIDSIASQVAQANFGDNTWGLSTDSSAMSSTAALYKPIPAKGSSITIGETSTYGSTTYPITIGTKVTDAIAYGTYSNTMIFSATSNTPPTPTTMQSMTSAYCASMTENASLQLTDTRNNKSYNIVKLQDGNCWMKENLSLGGSSTITLTPSDSDVTSNFTLPASSTWDTSSSNYTTPRLYLDSNNSGTSRDEVFYNWASATAGSGNSLTTQGDIAPSSICPKGWRLPTGGDDGEWQDIYDLYGEDDMITAMSLSFAGYFDPRYQTVFDQGGYGFWWSSVASSSDSAFGAVAGSDGFVFPASFNSRYYGNSVRCLAR